MLLKELISEIKKRLLSKFDIEKIILFGSQAKGSANIKSDIDLLLIGKVDYDRFEMMTDAFRALGRMNYVFDVVILTSDEVNRHKNISGTIASYALKEGRILYEKRK